MNIYYLGITSILTYLILALAQGMYLFGHFSASWKRYFVGTLLSISTHGWVLYQLIETPLGQNLNVLIMLSFTLWLMNIFILLTSMKVKVENLSVLTYPITALILSITLCGVGSDVIDTKTHPHMLAHIFISFLAMSLLSLASLQALLMGLQNTLLKHHHPSPMLQILPPLQTMETLLFNIIFSGMLFLSGSLLSGFFTQEHFLQVLFLPKTLLAFSAWILLTILLVGRYLFGWRGPTAIRWTMSGTLLAFLSYFGTKALLL